MNNRFKKRQWRRRGAGAHPRPFVSILPNVATILAMCCGMTAIRMSIMQSFEAAVFLVLLAALFDVLDGRLARLLNSTSQVGAELDSLSDLLNFGAAPAIILYLRHLHHWGEFGWAVVLFYTSCVALRLARFNVSQSVAPNNYHFVGVPSTAGGYLVLWLVMVEFAFGWQIPTLHVALYMILVGSLMVSKIPTFAVKTVKIQPHYVTPVLLGVVILAGLCYSRPWVVGSLMGILYLASIPVGALMFMRKKEAGDHSSSSSSISS